MPAIAHAQSIGRPYAHQSTQILYMQSQRGQSFSTYAQRGEGVKQKRTPCVQGGGGLYMEVRTQKRPFLHVFCFHYCFTKHFLTIFLSLKCFSVYFSMELFNGYLKTSH